ncbi:MAG: glycosyltransferase [Candidatus Gastranaerophilales bacterium]|nr:glycosyltransferase [Candidatus Gastranaerophilales bacterium]
MISIVIPTLQKRIDVLEKLIQNLNEDSSVGEIIIIDNSTKGIDFEYKKLRVITPKENLFVNPSWNLGAKEAKYDIVGLLNDDIIIPLNTCKKIQEKFNENPKIGAMGFHMDMVEAIDDIKEAPKEGELILSKADFVAGGYGIALFFKKELYKEIPEGMKIWFGDNFIFSQIKKSNFDNYWIRGQKVYHLGSLSSEGYKKSPIYKQDKKAWAKVKYKWYHYIFSVEEYSDCIKMRLLGLNIRLKSK